MDGKIRGSAYLHQVQTDERKKQAVNRMYKKPINAQINWYRIQNNLDEIRDSLDSCPFLYNDDAGEIADTMDGDDDLANEVVMTVTLLSQKAERLQEEMGDLVSYDNEDFEQTFDLFFASCTTPNENGELLGFNSFEDDYYPLSRGRWEENLAQKTASEKLQKKLTKAQLMENARNCFDVFLKYSEIAQEYLDYKGFVEVLTGFNEEVLRGINKVCELYDQGRTDSREFDRAIQDLPQDVWLR